MNKGINQSGRKLLALDPNYVVHDERSLLDLVQFTLSYSEAVAFHNQENKPIGNWRAFLLNDPVFIVAHIASYSFNSQKLIQEELELSGGVEFEKNLRIRSQIAENQLKMILVLFEWESLLEDAHDQGPILKEIKNAIKSVEALILYLLPFQNEISLARFPGIDRSNYGKSQEISLKDCFKFIYKNLVYIVEFAANSFGGYLNSKNANHEPHMGLLLACLKLFQEVKGDLNTLTTKHLDFYYQRILKQVPKDPKPLEVLVGLIPKDDAKFLPEYSSFSLMFPSKKVIPLSSKFLTDLTRAKISEIRSVYKSDYYPFSLGNKIGEFALNRVYDKLIYQGEEKQVISFEGVDPASFPVCFGEDQSLKGLSHQTMKNSLLGFAISSPLFLVEEGKHFFKISMELTKESASAFQKFLSELLYSRESYAGLIHHHSIKELKDFIHEFLNEAFTVSLTTKSGWKTLDFLQVDFLGDKSMLIFKLELEGELELPIPFSEVLHGGLEDTSWPCIRFFLKNTAHYPPYKPLSFLEIVSTEIQTLSKGVRKGVECYNQLGRLDPSNPFLPFGSIPTKDSYFRIYHPLVLNKYLNRLAIQLTWMGLPEQRNGFGDHYKDYPENIGNSSFKASIGVFSDGYKENSSNDKLDEVTHFFDSFEKSDGSYLMPTRLISLNLDLLDRTSLSEPKRLLLEKDQAYLSFKLASPIPFAFGHAQYTQIFGERSLYNSRFPKRQKELPKSPYTPLLERIEFTYSNFTKENFSRKTDQDQESIKFFHLYPFGFSKVFPASRSSISYLLPQVSEKGNLIIGLSDIIENQIINLGFKLYPAFFIHTVTKAPAVKWEFLENNQWYPLGNLLMEDSTNGMLHSGIVKIKLPPKIDLNSTRIGKGKFWLRVSYSSFSDINSRLINLFTNAAWLIETKKNQENELGIEELREFPSVLSHENSMIDGVLGPFHLHVSALRKSVDLDRIRISEQIRHRHRGVTTWDLERLILEQFPQIGRVLVYGRSDFKLQLVKNSYIQVVVIPQTPLLSAERMEGFRAPFELLQEIKAYIKSFLSPFAKIEVCNPVFERLKVRASIKFKIQQQAGYYRDKLERELIEFLSPNPGDLQKEKGFLSAIYKAEIQNFIESRSYVDFITGFSILQIVEVQGQFKIIDTASTDYKVELLRTISPYAILTSASSHQLEILDQAERRDPQLATIGDLSIDSEFIIKSSKN